MKLIVSHFFSCIRIGDLTREFEDFGTVTAMRIYRTQFKYPIAIIEMPNEEEANGAITELDGTTLFGFRIRVRPSKDSVNVPGPNVNSKTDKTKEKRMIRTKLDKHQRWLTIKLPMQTPKLTENGNLVVASSRGVQTDEAVFDGKPIHFVANAWVHPDEKPTKPVQPSRKRKVSQDHRQESAEVT